MMVAYVLQTGAITVGMREFLISVTRWPICVPIWLSNAVSQIIPLNQVQVQHRLQIQNLLWKSFYLT